MLRCLLPFSLGQLRICLIAPLVLIVSLITVALPFPGLRIRQGVRGGNRPCQPQIGCEAVAFDRVAEQIHMAEEGSTATTAPATSAPSTVEATLDAASSAGETAGAGNIGLSVPSDSACASKLDGGKTRVVNDLKLFIYNLRDYDNKHDLRKLLTKNNVKFRNVQKRPVRHIKYGFVSFETVEDRVAAEKQICNIEWKEKRA